MGNLFNRIRRPSLRQGVIFGLILAAIEIALSLASNYIPQTSVQEGLGTVALGAFLVIGYIVGMRAAQETGKMGTGIAAGLWAGLIGSLLESAIPLVINLIYLPTIVAGYQQDFKHNPANYPGMKITDITSSYILSGLVLEVLAEVVLYTLLVLVGAVLGSFMGKRRFRSRVGSTLGSQSEDLNAGEMANVIDSVE